jgi:hypothetical protein
MSNSLILIPFVMDPVILLSTVTSYELEDWD